MDQVEPAKHNDMLKRTEARIAGRDHILERLEMAEDELISNLNRVRLLKSQVRFMADANLLSDLVDQFARMNFLSW